MFFSFLQSHEIIENVPKIWKFFPGGGAKNPHYRDFFENNKSLHRRGKIPSTGIFLKVSNLSTTVETLAQYAHPGKSEKLKVFPPQYGVHTQGHFEKKQTLHTTPKSPHTGELFENFQVFTHRGKTRKKWKSPAQGIFREKSISPPPAPFEAPYKK